MLYHKFSFFERNINEEYNTIRISDSFVQKMIPDLLKYRFTWNGYSHPKYGLSQDFTIIKPGKVGQLKACLLLQPQGEREYGKLLKFIDEALANHLGIIHQNGAPSRLVHEFMLCDKLPQELNIRLYRDSCVKIQDQFILENYDVFKKVSPYWDSLNHTGPGFNYYGTTIITPPIAQLLLDAMSQFLESDSSEAAEYFPGEEYDILCDLLRKSVADRQFLIHFGI